ncbi:MAG TPA: hypothetical protein PKZ42_08440 [Syntrophales bacterium]|nr:hypothetical protein [Syntrophales bacterium]
MSSVEFITTIQRRRRWSLTEKKTRGAHKYDLHLNQLFTWHYLLYEGWLSAVEEGEGERVVMVSEVNELCSRIRKIERLLDRKTMEVEILKDVVRIAREKTDIARSLSGEGDCRNDERISNVSV